MAKRSWTGDPVTLLRVDPRAAVDLAAIDSRSTPGFDGDKSDGRALLAQGEHELSELQEKLFAASRGAGDTRSVLLLLQGMDTSGKGGIVRHVVGAVDPQGVAHTAFKAPTHEELEHDFLWRVRKRLPDAGLIGVFDRSHYEDVLIARVRGLAPSDAIAERYVHIREFESQIRESGTTMVKVLLHISPDEQKERLMERLQRPDKYWKYNPGDIDERGRWDAYRQAYERAIEETSTAASPWFIVPADRKWYARLAVQQLLTNALRGLELRWPAADFDVEAEKARLAVS